MVMELGRQMMRQERSGRHGGRAGRAGEDSEEVIFEPEGDEEEGEREEGEEAEAAERDWKAGLLNMLTPSVTPEPQLCVRVNLLDTGAFHQEKPEKDHQQWRRGRRDATASTPAAAGPATRYESAEDDQECRNYSECGEGEKRKIRRRRRRRGG